MIEGGEEGMEESDTSSDTPLGKRKHEESWHLI